VFDLAQICKRGLLCHGFIDGQSIGKCMPNGEAPEEAACQETSSSGIFDQAQICKRGLACDGFGPRQNGTCVPDGEAQEEAACRESSFNGSFELSKMCNRGLVCLGFFIQGDRLGTCVPKPTPAPPFQSSPSTDDDKMSGTLILLVQDVLMLLGVCAVLVAGIFTCCFSAKRREHMIDFVLEEAFAPELTDFPEETGEESLMLSKTLLFYFIDRQAILQATGPLPEFRELLRQEAIVPKYINVEELIEHQAKYLAVSHRWETVTHPDPHGSQQEEVRKFLLGPGAEVQWLWFDYWCLPQGIRSKRETDLFKATLKHMDALYLFLPVLLLVDKQYSGRFWTCFEAFLSMQHVDVDGRMAGALLQRPSGKTGERGAGGTSCAEGQPRYNIAVLGASGVGEARAAAEIASLETMWGHASVDEALGVLSHSDILVTNLHDKTMALEVLVKLPKQVKRAKESFKARSTTSISESSAWPEPLAKANFPECPPGI